jgi:hypothetical protein
MKNVLVIDIGSHKAEEAMLLEGRPNLSNRNRYRLLRQAKFDPRRATAEILAIRRESEAFAATYSCRHILVEPVMHRELIEFVATSKNALLVNGVVSCDPSHETTLFMAGDSLGNSIRPEKPGLTGQTTTTFNINFVKFYEFLMDVYVRSGDCDKIILRMNAEGVEGPIIEWLANEADIRPDMLAGSIGDIKKCFGQAAYDKALADLERAGIPYIYFTSFPTAWLTGLRQITAALA